MAITPTGDRNVDAAVTRAARVTWFGENSTVTEHPPHCLNNENVKTVNAAGTAYVNLIKADASNVVTLPNGATVPAGQTLTVTGTMALGGNANDSAGVNRLILNPTAKTIVDGSATSLFDVACAASGLSGGVIFYQVQVGDGTDFQSLTGMVTYSCVNKAATLTLTITEVAGNQAKAVSSGTLTLAWTFVTGTNKGTVKLQPTGSLTETTPYTVTYTVLPISGAVTIL